MRVRCFTMQRDDDALIDAWWRYHGHLFGTENLTILDNGSIRPDTVRRLRGFQRAGSTVLWQYRSDADYANRHAHFDGLAKRDDGQDGLAIGLDCDEWLALFAPDGLTCERDAISAYLDRPDWASPGRVLAVGGALLNVPTVPGFFLNGPASRRLVTSGPAGHEGGGVQATDLVVVRFCNRPLRAMADAGAEGGATPFEVVGAPGAMDASQCGRFFAGKLLVEFSELARLGEAVGIEDGLLGRPEPDLPEGVSRVLLPGRPDADRTPTTFDARSYLSANPDVAEAGWPALEHFVRHGCHEGRSW